jgi:hypothetical protein
MAKFSPEETPDNDERSDLQQAVEARSDAVARGEGGEKSPGEDAGADGGTAGTGDVKSQDVAPGAPTGSR